MKLLCDDEVPSPPSVQSYQETRWSGLFIGIGIFSTAMAPIVVALRAGVWNSPWLFFVICLFAFSVMLMARYAFKTFFASQRPENWRLRWSSDGLYLRYRSYLNGRFPADTSSVLYLARCEVSWLEAHEDILETPDEVGSWSLTRKHRWLEIALRNVDLTPIREALTEEAKRRDPRGGRVNDYPLSVTRDGTLRLQLGKPEAVAHLLRIDYSVALPEESSSGGFNEMSQAEQEDHVLALAAAGDTFAAIKAAREVYGFDLTEAKKFVEQLQGRGDAVGPGPPNRV